MSEMSVEVPPMSNGIRFGVDSSSAAYIEPATPPAGPERTVAAASRIASSTGATPPWLNMMNSGP